MKEVSIILVRGNQDIRFFENRLSYKFLYQAQASTYDHRLRRIGHPVRSASHKPQIGGLVVGWVTTSESLLLYVYIRSFLVFQNSAGVKSIISYLKALLLDDLNDRSSFTSQLHCFVVETLDNEVNSRKKFTP